MQHQWLASLALDALTTRNSGKGCMKVSHLINPLPELVNKDFPQAPRPDPHYPFGGYN